MNRLLFVSIFLLSSSIVAFAEWPSLNEQEWVEMEISELQVYIDNFGIDKLNAQGLNALSYALMAGADLEIVIHLIESGADVNVTINEDGTNCPLLFLVIDYNDLNLLRSFLEQDIDFDVNLGIDYDSKTLSLFLREVLNKEEIYEEPVLFLLDHYLKTGDVLDKVLCGYYENEEEGIYDSFDFLDENICFVTDGIFYFEHYAEYVRNGDTVRIIDNDGKTIRLEIVDDNTLVGSGFARGIYSRW